MTLPNKLTEKLSCLEHKNQRLIYNESKEVLLCPNCKREYPVYFGIPSIVQGNPEEEKWNPWSLDEVEMMGNSYYKRSTGELPEKEASKSYARFLKRHKLYSKGDTLVDIGCATGHFLRSFRRLLDEKVSYTGIDTHFRFLRWGREVFGVTDTCNFVHCDALNLPFVNNSFDIVIVNLFHFFPRIDVPLKEAMRIAKKYVVWRTPLGKKANYMIKFVLDEPFDKFKILTHDREDVDYSLYMLYTKKYIKGLVDSLGGKVKLIERDDDFENFDNTALADFAHVPATKTVNGIQINGNLVMDWHYIVIDCK